MNEQDTAAQVSALKSAGCEKIFREKASGGRWDGPELHRLLDQLRRGDILVVWRLGRRPKLRPQQQEEIVAMVSKGTKSAADAARLFNVHPATVSRLLANAGVGT